MSFTFHPISASPAVAAFVTFVTVVLSLRWLSRCNMRTRTYPPGPPTLPILGNIHQMPTRFPFLKYTEWSRRYGEIIGLKVGPLNMIILNNPEAIQILFANRASIYSGRPVPYLVRNFIYPGQEQALMFQNDAKLRRMRASLKALTGSAGLKDALPMQDQIASKLVTNLRENTYSAATCIGMWSFETALTATMGPVGTEKATPEVFKRWTGAQHGLLDILESVVTLLYDIVPAIKYIPASPGKGSAKAIGESLWNLYVDCMSSLKRRMSQAEQSGEDVSYWGLIATILRSQEKMEAGEKHVSAKKAELWHTEASLTSLAQTMTDAGTDTTTSVALSLISVFAVNQDIRQKAQAEIDQTCDRESEVGPTYSDIGKLVYLKACILETLRWRSPAPLYIPHRLEEDDTFQGYHFPKDSIIMANAWAIFHNPTYHKDPDRFDPERFIGDKLDGIPFQPFGLGRRVCPGDQFAMNSLTIVLSKLLWSFDFVLDGPVPDLSIEGGYDTGIILSPKSLPVKFVPRNSGQRSI